MHRGSRRVSRAAGAAPGQGARVSCGSWSHKAQPQPKRIVFPEGEHDKILRACQILVDEKHRPPDSAGRGGCDSRARFEELGLHRKACEIIDPAASTREPLHRGILPPAPAQRHHAHGSRRADAEPQLFGAMMVRLGDADALHRRRHASTIPRPSARRCKSSASAQGCERVSGALRDDHAARRHLLPGRRHREHRTDGRRPGRDRAFCAADVARRFNVEPRVAHAVVLEFRQHAASAGGEGARAPPKS